MGGPPARPRLILCFAECLRGNWPPRRYRPAAPVRPACRDPGLEVARDLLLPRSWKGRSSSAWLTPASRNPDTERLGRLEQIPRGAVRELCLPRTLRARPCQRPAGLLVSSTRSDADPRCRVSARAWNHSRILRNQISIRERDPSHNKLTAQARTAPDTRGRPSANSQAPAKQKPRGLLQSARASARSQAAPAGCGARAAGTRSRACTGTACRSR